MVSKDDRQWLIEQAGLAMIHCGNRWKVGLAIAAHESACGKSKLARESYNLHGIKAVGGQNKADDGVHRRFEDEDAAWKAFAYLIRHSMHYKQFSRLNDYDYVVAIGPVYCPADSNWANKVLWWYSVIEEVMNGGWSSDVSGTSEAQGP